MAVAARQRAPKPIQPARPKRPRIVYRAVSEPGRDEERGEEILIRFLASLVTM